ncbi:MAG: pseudouridine synthase [Saprospiraceae bacterium]
MARKFTRSRARNSAPPPGRERPEADIIGMRLNKYVSHSGIASRREAAELVKTGKVSVNGQVEFNPGYQIVDGDKVTYQGKEIQPSERFVYLLLNKPAGVITTTSDDRGRKTVMDLLKEDIKERIFPVGRLDRDTTGLLLLTNDGDTGKRLLHPKHKVAKVYKATLDKNVTRADLDKIRAGVELEDGPAPVNWANYSNDVNKKSVTLEITIGRNRVVRRIFLSLGYTVEKLDRAYLAGLTKKDLPRGYYRHLTEEEIRMIRHFS